MLTKEEYVRQNMHDLTISVTFRGGYWDGCVDEGYRDGERETSHETTCAETKERALELVWGSFLRDVESAYDKLRESYELGRDEFIRRFVDEHLSATVIYTGNGVFYALNKSILGTTRDAVLAELSTRFAEMGAFRYGRISYDLGMSK